MELQIEHNLRPEELGDTLIALAKSHGLEHEVHECLTKAVTFTEKEPRDPAMAEMVRLWNREFAEALEWIGDYVPRLRETDRSPRFAFWKGLAKKVDEGPLTPAEIRQIQEAIRERFGFIAAKLETDFVPDRRTLKRWKDLGIISPDVTADDFVSMSADAKLVRNAFIFGRLHLAVEQGATTYQDILQIALTAPLTKADKFAVQVAERQAAAYITRFAEDCVADVSSAYAQQARQTVHDMTVLLHQKKLEVTALNDFAEPRVVENWRQFASELYHRMDDKARDWQRIGFYELHDAEKYGKGLGLLEKYGTEQLVYKDPLPTACPQCRHLYLDETTGRPVPRLFRLGTMLGYGNNIGRRPMPVRGGRVASDERPDGADTLKAVAGLIHPYCECGGPFVATGHEWWYPQAEKPK